MDLMVRISGSIYLLILFIFLGIGFILWFYYRTIPTVSVFSKVIFIILRSVAFVLILLVLFGTILHLIFKQEELAELALLIDDSASMQISDKGIKRSEVLKEILHSSSLIKVKQKFHIYPYRFSDKTNKIKGDFLDSLSFKGRGTDLASALISVTEKKGNNKPNAILLFSDGNYNIGDNPVRVADQLNIPIFSTAIGDTAEKSDIILTKVLTNDITYKDNFTSCMVSLQGYGFGEKNVTVRLKQGGKVLNRKMVTIPNNDMEATVDFEFKLHGAGINKLSVEVDHLEGEFTSNNNSREFYIKVLESRMRILLLASSPSPDLAFLKRILLADENVELTVRTQKRSGSFYEGSFPDKSNFDELDLLIMLDFPSSSTPASIWEIVKSTIIDKQVPFMFFAGRNFDINRINNIKDFMPCTLDRKLKGVVESPVVNQENKFHPLLKIKNNSSIFSWSTLPPIFPGCRVSSVKPGDRVLCETAKDIYSDKSSINKNPLILVHQAGKDKSIVFLGYGFYRWDLVMWGIGKTNEVLGGFIGNSVRWLSVHEQGDRVILKTNEYNYRAGEKVFFSVQVYNQEYKPEQGATVRLKISTPRRVEEIDLTDMGDGQYYGEKRFFETGTYQISAEAVVENRMLGKDEQEFSVDNFNPEFINTKADFNLLEELSSITGGKCFYKHNLDSLYQFIQFEPKQVESSKEIEFFQSPWVLVLIILLLSADWFLRKQKGML